MNLANRQYTQTNLAGGMKKLNILYTKSTQTSGFFLFKCFAKNGFYLPLARENTRHDAIFVPNNLC